MFNTLENQFYSAIVVFTAVCIILILFMAGICGAISKLKRLDEERQNEIQNHISVCTANYPYTCPTLQPGEELSRRGFSMYQGNDFPLRVPLDRNLSEINAFQSRVDKYNQRSDGTKDANSDFSVINSETIIVQGADGEMHIAETTEYVEYPPPPSKVHKKIEDKTEFTTDYGTPSSMNDNSIKSNENTK